MDRDLCYSLLKNIVDKKKGISTPGRILSTLDKQSSSNVVSSPSKVQALSEQEEIIGSNIGNTKNGSPSKSTVSNFSQATLSSTLPITESTVLSNEIKPIISSPDLSTLFKASSITPLHQQTFPQSVEKIYNTCWKFVDSYTDFLLENGKILAIKFF